MEKDVPNEFDFGVNIDRDISSSQNSNLAENKLNDIIFQSKPENMTKSTNWGIFKFKTWTVKEIL